MAIIIGRNKIEKTAAAGHPGRAGFTLVETLVALAVFSLSMGVVTQIFSYSMHIQRFLTAHYQMTNEMSYNLEHISRGLRMAKKSEDALCLPGAGMNFQQPGPHGGIRFLNPKLNGGYECVEYYLEGQRLMESRDSAAWNFDLPLTSPDVKILAFTATGAGWSQEDVLQPRVTIYIKAESKEGEILENQITISQRDIDVNE